MVPSKLASKLPQVELFNIALPRVTLEEAASFLLERISNREGTCVCFPNLSMVNILEKEPELKSLIASHFVTFNDGLGLHIASLLRGRPFLEDCNGTDLVPLLLSRLPPHTSLYLIGSSGNIAEKTRTAWSSSYPAVDFIGARSGFFASDEEELASVDALKRCRPDLILVGMGNPRQLQFIAKHSANPELSHTQWIAVGGLFDFYGGSRYRGPDWMIKARLEWLHILLTEHHKFRRYIKGIPKFGLYLLKKTLSFDHDVTV